MIHAAVTACAAPTPVSRLVYFPRTRRLWWAFTCDAHVHLLQAPRPRRPRAGRPRRTPRHRRQSAWAAGPGARLGRATARRYGLQLRRRARRLEGRRGPVATAWRPGSWGLVHHVQAALLDVRGFRSGGTPLNSPFVPSTPGCGAYDTSGNIPGRCIGDHHRQTDLRDRRRSDSILPTSSASAS